MLSSNSTKAPISIRRTRPHLLLFFLLGLAQVVVLDILPLTLLTLATGRPRQTYMSDTYTAVHGIPELAGGAVKSTARVERMSAGLTRSRGGVGFMAQGRRTSQTQKRRRKWSSGKRRSDG